MRNRVEIEMEPARLVGTWSSGVLHGTSLLESPTVGTVFFFEGLYSDWSLCGESYIGDGWC